MNLNSLLVEKYLTALMKFPFFPICKKELIKSCSFPHKNIRKIERKKAQGLSRLSQSN